MSSDPDETVRLPAPRAIAPSPGAKPAGLRPVPSRRGLLLGGALLILLGGGGAAWYVLQGRPAPEIAAPPAPVIPVPAPATPAPSLAVPAFATRDRDAILRWQPEVPTFVRLAERPAIFVLAFPDHATQGRMLNRVAALIEKSRAPRDRVLHARELRDIIAADGANPDTYYSGHDYALEDVERFFALAATNDVPLNAEERWLLAQIPAIRASGGTGPLALISVPNEGADFDAASRRAVLDHEICHGLFFTDPAFAVRVVNAWRTTFTEAERAAFRAFLAREGYDTTNESLMANEAMAYLSCTPDPRFFDPRRDVGLDPATAARLRDAMRP